MRAAGTVTSSTHIKSPKHLRKESAHEISDKADGLAKMKPDKAKNDY